MSRQNIYDNETFYEGYKKIRENPLNANNLFEIPALFSLMPRLQGKKVLDLGCGFGEHCKKIVEGGAQRVVGIDISEKMISSARAENSDSEIVYMNMAIEDIDQLDEKFDIVVSSLAFHYVEDFSSAVKKIYNLLSNNGILIFSQENPLCTCHAGGERWTKDDEGNKLYVNIANYSVEGERESSWLVDNVMKYHRTFSTIVNTLIENGFTIERMIEPVPSEEMLKKYPEYSDLLHKPDFLIISAVKR